MNQYFISFEDFRETTTKRTLKNRPNRLVFTIKHGCVDYRKQKLCRPRNSDPFGAALRWGQGPVCQHRKHDQRADSSYVDSRSGGAVTGKVARGLYEISSSAVNNKRAPATADALQSLRGPSESLLNRIPLCVNRNPALNIHWTSVVGAVGILCSTGGSRSQLVSMDVKGQICLARFLRALAV